MMAAAERADNTFTGNNGAESSFNQDLTVSSYLSLSGGNNGLNSGQIISAWSLLLSELTCWLIMQPSAGRKSSVMNWEILCVMGRVLA
jgi:hypothetical protein